MTFSVVVLASGSGSLFEALLEHQNHFQVSALITDNQDARAIDIAKNHQVNLEIVSLNNFASRLKWNDAVLAAINSYDPDLVVSAGFMKVLGPSVVNALPGKLINIHPSLLPKFPGAHAVSDALAAGVNVTGTTVHYVDAGVDTGEVILQREVLIHQGDSVESLHERIKVVERSLIVGVVNSFAEKALQ